MHLLNPEYTVYMAWDEELCNSLSSKNIDVIPSVKLCQLRDNESQHADMQLCIIKNTAFITEDIICHKSTFETFGYEVIVCKSLAEPYPNNVSLNVAVIGNKLFCKRSALDRQISEFCNRENIEIINVNQGYAKCSTLLLNDNAIITADSTICEAAKKQGIEVLKISPGNIHLKDADYGFIGGCSGVIDKTVYFFGDVTKHKDSEKILCFLDKHNMDFICLGESKLKDIGGFVLLKHSV